MREFNRGVGIWQLLNSSVITDIICKSGFDYTLLDLEHGLFDINSIQNCVFASKSSKLQTIARIPNISYKEIVQVIDTGVDGILFPHIDNKNDLDIAIKEIFLPPDGEKSFSPFVPKYKYGISKDFDQNNPFLGILIESKVGILNIDDLLSNKYVDFVYFGAYDLSVEYLMPGKIFEKKILEDLKNLKQCALKNNKKVMAIYRTKEELELLLKMGVDIPIASVDTSQFIKKLINEYNIYQRIRNINS